MLVNITDVFASDGKVIEGEYPFGATEVAYGGGVHPVKACTPVSVRIAPSGQRKALAEAAAGITVVLPCDRCLRDVEYVFVLKAEREVTAPETAFPDELDEQDAFMEGYELNIDNLMIDEMITGWPEKVLCRPDCRGLCPVCGKDLNTGACGCDTFVPDPRMAAIKDVFNENKEV